MNLKAKEAQLLAQLDSPNFDMDKFDSVNKELLQIQEQISVQEQARKAIIAAKKLEEQEELALNKILSLTEEEVDKMYQEAYEKYAGNVNGVPFEVWFDQSTKYYHIDEKFNLISKARSSNTEEVVPCQNRVHARHVMLKRIKYKMYDHAVRGHDFAYEQD